MTYHFTKVIDVPFDRAIDVVIEALADKGFGILTKIDVEATLKKKLDVSFRPYTIRGACNRNFAYQALQHENKNWHDATVERDHSAARRWHGGSLGRRSGCINAINR